MTGAADDPSETYLFGDADMFVQCNAARESTVYGMDGDDTVQGDNGHDLCHGKLVIIARFGNDTVQAGDGADTFVFRAADAGTVEGDATAGLSSGPKAVVVAVGRVTVALHGGGGGCPPDFGCKVGGQTV